MPGHGPPTEVMVGPESKPYRTGGDLSGLCFPSSAMMASGSGYF